MLPITKNMCTKRFNDKDNIDGYAYLDSTYLVCSSLYGGRNQYLVHSALTYCAIINANNDGNPFDSETIYSNDGSTRSVHYCSLV